MERTVIVGAGIGGLQTAFMLSESKEQKVVLITNEGFLPYWRMRLTEVVSGSDPDTIRVHDRSWYEEKNIEIVNKEAVSIDCSSKIVTLSDGEKIGYDNLVLATGANPLKAPISGEEKQYVLRNMNDALLLREALSKGVNSVCVIGGGLLGLELASAIAKKYSVKSTCIETHDHILSRQLDAGSADYLQKKLEKLNVHVITSGNAKSADDGKLYLEDGRAVDFDVLIASIGVRADVGLAKNAGLAVNRGILVDKFLRTIDSSIYAIGDSSEMDGRLFSLAMYARDMANHVSKEMLTHTDIAYVPPIPSTLLKVAGVEVAVFGSRDGDSVVFDKPNGRVTVFKEDNAVTGVILIDAKEYMIKAKGMIGKPFDREVFEN